MMQAWRKAGIWVALIGCLVATVGCGVRQRVIVTTEPSGAEVFMNGVSLGTTPLEQPFIWYWYYDFIATKEGFETTGERVRFRTPWYMLPGLDLLMEMMPFPVRDTRRVHLVLDPGDERPDPVLTATPELTTRSLGAEGSD